MPNSDGHGGNHRVLWRVRPVSRLGVPRHQQTTPRNNPPRPLAPHRRRIALEAIPPPQQPHALHKQEPSVAKLAVAKIPGRHSQDASHRESTADPRGAGSSPGRKSTERQPPLTSRFQKRGAKVGNWAGFWSRAAPKSVTSVEERSRIRAGPARRRYRCRPWRRTNAPGRIPGGSAEEMSVLSSRAREHPGRRTGGVPTHPHQLLIARTHNDKALLPLDPGMENGVPLAIRRSARRAIATPESGLFETSGRRGQPFRI